MMIEKNAPINEALEKLRANYSENRKKNNQTKDKWGSPTPLSSITPSVRHLPDNLIPAPIYDWINDCAERISAPSEYFLIGFFTMLSGLVARQFCIQPKEKDSSWVVIPNLWGMIIGPPSILKSAYLKMMQKPFLELEAKLKEEYRPQEREIKARREILKKNRKNLTNSIGTKKGEALVKAKRELELILEAEEELEKKESPRLFVNDSTTEKVCDLHKSDPKCLIIFRDELSGFIKLLEKPGREGDREFYLEGWNGGSSFTQDRIGRGTVHVSDLTLSIIGTIQPEKLAPLLKDITLYGGDGLVPRFQMMIFPNKSEWKLIDREPNSKAYEKVEYILARINDGISNPQLSEMKKSNDRVIVKFSREGENAQSYFNVWWSGLEADLRNSEMPLQIEGHLGKFRSLMPTLALLYWVLDWASGETHKFEISIEHAKKAAKLCNYLKEHAAKIYKVDLNHSYKSAQTLAEKIKNGEIKNGQTCRSIYRHNWSYMKTKQEFDSGASILTDLNWIRTKEVCKGNGAPSEIIEINPHLHELFD